MNESAMITVVGFKTQNHNFSGAAEGAYNNKVSETVPAFPNENRVICLRLFRVFSPSHRILCAECVGTLHSCFPSSGTQDGARQRRWER